MAWSNERVQQMIELEFSNSWTDCLASHRERRIVEVRAASLSEVGLDAIFVDYRVMCRFTLFFV
jgi:hypothetical protein